MCIVCLCVVCKIALCVALTSVLPLQVVRIMPVATQSVVELVCQVPWRVISTPLAYNALLVVVCSYYAFKTRHFPDNFNEARFINFCVRGLFITSFINFLTEFSHRRRSRGQGIDLSLHF